MEGNYYLCTENGEFFVIKAATLKEADESASTWGGNVVRELTPAELYCSDPENGKFDIHLD